MRRGTTPTLACELTGVDLTDCKIYVTLKQGDLELTKENPTVVSTSTGCIVNVPLSQAETLSFPRGVAYVQIRWIDENGLACATEEQLLKIDGILKQGEISYE